MQEAGDNLKPSPSMEFKFLSNSFDEIKYLHNHLNATEDVEKVNTISALKLTQNLGSYLMRCVVTSLCLFEVEDAYG